VLGSFSSANLAGALTDETGSGAAVFATSPTLVTPILGTPQSGVATNLTGLPLTTGVTGTLPVANGGTGITSFGAGVATWLGTPSSANLAAAVTDETGTGALVFANSPTLVTPALGTPASGVLTNTTGLPLTTGVTGTLPVANGGTGLTSYTANGVIYASGTGTLASGSALTFDGTNLGVGGGAAINFGGSLVLYGDSTVTALRGRATSGIIFQDSSATEQMRLTSTGLEVKGKLAVGYSDFSGIPTNGAAFAGSVGIGTSSPFYKLSVRQPTLTATIAEFRTIDGTNNPGLEIRTSTAGTTLAQVYSSGATANLLFETNSIERLRIDSAGNLGLGVTPAAGWAGYKAIQVGGFCAFGGYPLDTLVFVSSNAYNDNTNWRYIVGSAASRYQQNAGSHQWYIAPSGTADDPITFTEAMTLTAAGSLLVGATSAVNDSKFLVAGAGILTPAVIQGAANTGAYLYFYNNAATTNGMVIGQGLIASDDNIGLLYNTANAPLSFGTNNIERMRLDPTGNYLRMASGSGGIQFNGDTAAANALDDYEEGVWTMGVSFGGASVAVTYSTNTGKYTKIGRQVTVNGLVELTNKGSSTGDAAITGLPFTIANAFENYAAASIRISVISFSDTPQADGLINSTQINLSEVTNAGVFTRLTDADFANTSSIMVTLTYFTA
jgi:hypothetical protein